MASKKPVKPHPEQIEVSIEHAQRQVIPAVKLEQKEIKMTFMTAESVPTAAIETKNVHPQTQTQTQTTEKIVGQKFPLGEEQTAPSTASDKTSAKPATSEISKSATSEISKFTTSDITKSATSKVVKSTSDKPPASSGVPHQGGHHGNEKEGSKLTVDYSPTSPKRMESRFMEIIEEQEKALQEQFRSLPRKPKKPRSPRSPSPSPVRQSIGLDHLDNLVRLMEQLGSLRDENSKLKKRCAYLESTKYLLQVKSDLAGDSTVANYPHSYRSLPTRKSIKRKKMEEKENLHGVRARLSSAEDIECLEVMESCSDQSPKRPKHAALHKRSFSTGSLEIPSDILEQSGEDDGSDKVHSKSYDKGMKPNGKSAKGNSKKTSKSSKWARVKKVISGPKLEDIRFSLRSFKGGHSRYPPSGTHQELTVPSAGITESRSVDSGVGSGLEAESQEGRGKHSSSSGGPPSPSAYQTKHMLPNLNSKGEELSSEIWMGPPGWLEKHEKEKLESPKEHLGTEITSDMLYGKILTHREGEMERYLTVPLTRRKSSPSLVDEALTDESLEAARLHRSSSYKDKCLELENSEAKESSNEDSPKSDKEKKYHRTAWGKVKDMIHTRKDSLKRRYSRKPGKSDADQMGEELSEVDIEICEELDDILEGPLGRSTPKSSPIVLRQQREKSLSDSPPGSKALPHRLDGGSVDVAALLGGVSDDFSRKLAEWEELRSKRSSTHGRGQDGTDAGLDSPEFEQVVEDWDKHKSMKGKSKSEWVSSDGSPELPSTPQDSHNLSVNVDEMQRKLTESFSRKLEEWERKKYRKEGSPSSDRKDSTTRSIIRKEDRQKSKKSKGEKEREKVARMRERELQRVEREQQKLEKERIRLEKERLKALEREARIEKMKGRLSQAEIETFKSPVLSPLAECKVTSEFARKLHEWEIMKGMPYPSSASMYLEAHHRSLEKAKEYQVAETSVSTRRDNGELEESFTEEGHQKKRKGVKPPPLTLQQCLDSPEDTSPMDRMSDISFGDDTTATNESISRSNISRSLEKANARLVEELVAKELEYSSLHTEVEELNEKLNKVKEHHSREINQMKKDQIAGSPTRKLDFDAEAHAANLLELEEKIMELQTFGQKLAASMESAAICKWQSIEGEEQVNARLLELLEQMRFMLLQASQSDEVSQQDSAMQSYEKLYNQSMQLQVQMNNLRLSQLERNKEIVDMKRQLLLQEANNLLLQADITRRESELYQFQDGSRKGGVLKRWNTYSGVEEDRMRIMKSMTSPRKQVFSFGDREIVEEGLNDDKNRKPSLEEDSDHHTEIHSDDVFEPVADTPSVDPTPSKLVTDHDSGHMTYQKGSIAVSDPPTIKTKKSDGGDTAVEICTMSLPTATVMMPRDLSQQELNVPRSRHELENTPPSQKKDSQSLTPFYSESNVSSASAVTSSQRNEIKSKKIFDSENNASPVMRDSHKIDCTGSRTEPKFPELLIPQWRKTPERGPTLDDSGSGVADILEQPDLSMDSTSTETPTLDQSFESLDSSMTKTDPDSHSPRTPKHTPHKPARASFEEVSKPAPLVPFPLMRLSDSIMSEKLNKPSQDMLTQLERRKLSEGNCRSEPELRNTPELRMISPMPVCHLPPVSPTNIRRVQPAKEILQESRRYRSGHSIYMTRILQKRSLREDLRKCIEDRIRLNKENVAEGFVQKMVERLSREGTPENGIKAGELTPKTMALHRTDSPRSQSEFVQQIVHKLSSPSGLEHSRTNAPLKDVTNDGKVRKLAEAFDSGSSRGSPERTVLDSDYQAYRTIIVSSKRKSCEFFRDSSSSTSTLTFTHSLSTTSHIEASSSHKPEPTIIATNCSSMPLISHEKHREIPNGHRERSATCSTSYDQTKGKSNVAYPTSHPDDDISQIDILSEGSLHSSTSSLKCAFPKTSPSVGHGEVHSPKSSHKKGFGKIRMGTIGALCKQTISFDLGISLQKFSSKTASETSGSSTKKQKHSFKVCEGDHGDQQERPLLMAVEGSPQLSPREPQVRPPSPNSDIELCPTSPDEKKKTRSLGWLQKPKRFFKISKCRRCCPKSSPGSSMMNEKCSFCGLLDSESLNNS